MGKVVNQTRLAHLRGRVKVILLKNVLPGTVFRYNNMWRKKDGYSFFSWKVGNASYCEEIFDHQDRYVAVHC